MVALSSAEAQVDEQVMSIDSSSLGLRISLIVRAARDTASTSFVDVRTAVDGAPVLMVSTDKSVPALGVVDIQLSSSTQSSAALRPSSWSNSFTMPLTPCLSTFL